MTRGDFGPTPCPICGSIGARALMLDHIEAEHADLTAALKRLAHAIALMDTIGARVASTANPCPSRDEWEAVRALLLDLESASWEPE